MDDTTTLGRSTNSSGYVRVVGTVRLEVVRTAQRTDDVTKTALKTKWAVMSYSGKKKQMIAGFDRKYDAIAALLAQETVLKAALADTDA